MVVEKSVLMKVVFPRPDSPATCDGQTNGIKTRTGKHTIMVKAAPRFATILCLCYVRLSACVSSGSAYRWLGSCDNY
jgi:hypothetical protein